MKKKLKKQQTSWTRTLKIQFKAHFYKLGNSIQMSTLRWKNVSCVDSTIRGLVKYKQIIQHSLLVINTLSENLYFKF